MYQSLKTLNITLVLLFVMSAFTGHSFAQQLSNVQILNTGWLPDGRPCQKFIADAVIGGRVQQVHGVACEMPDKSWRIVQENASPPQQQTWYVPQRRYPPQQLQHYRVAPVTRHSSVQSACSDRFYGSTTKTYRSPNYRRLGHLLDSSRRRHHRGNGRIIGELADSFFPRVTKRSRESTHCSSEIYYTGGRPGRTKY